MDRVTQLFLGMHVIVFMGMNAPEFDLFRAQFRF